MVQGKWFQPGDDAAEAFAAAQLERGFKTLDFYKSLQPVEVLQK